MTNGIYRINTRFVINFSYKCKNRKEYQSICKRIDNLQKHFDKDINVWVPLDYSNLQNELYSHVQLFVTSDQESTKESLGRAWVSNKELKRHYSLKGTCEMKDLEHSFLINSSGLFLFKTGIGIFWFEIDYADNQIEDIIRMNYNIKNISYSQCVPNLTRIAKETLEIFCKEEAITNIDKPGSYKIENLQNKFIVINDLPSSGEITKVIARHMPGGDKYFAQVTTNDKYSIQQFIDESLEPLEILNYFSERHSSTTDFKIPDKAYVFTMSILDQTQALDDDKLRRYLFWLKKGYKPSYLPSFEHLKDELLQSFENSYWGASLEGCANIVCLTGNDETTDAFFKETYWKRREIYFYLYVLVLHQFTTLLSISNKIAKLPIDIKDYQKLSSKESEDLVQYNEMVNLFCMKSFYSQVSHISHQNEYYNYLIKQFGIRTSIKDMQDSLLIVNQLVQNARAANRSEKWRIFAILGGLFVLIQTISSILTIYFMNIQGVSERFSIGFFTISIMIISSFIGLIAWMISRISKK